MAAINYPSIPNFFDPEAVMQATDRGYQDGKNWRAEKDAPALWLSSLEQQLRTGQTQPNPPSHAQFLANLDPNTGQVQRAALPPVNDPNSARVQQAFTAQGSGSSANTVNGNQIAGRFIKAVRDGGVTNPFALAAIAATGKAESGFDPKNAFSTWSDPSQSGAAGTAGGIMSWRGPRLQAMQQFAQQNGDNPNAPSPETQGKFLLQEDPSLMQKLQGAQSPEEAAQIMANAWKFAGFNQAGGEAAQRVAATQAYAPQFGAGQAQGGFQGAAPSQQALEGLAVGQSASMPQGGPQPSPYAPDGGPMQQPGQQVAVQSQQPPDGGLGPGMPDRTTLKALFANPLTRPYAINLAQSRIALMQNQNDPQKQLEYQIAVEKLKALRDPQAKLINAGGGAIYDPNSGKWITQDSGGPTKFAGTGLDAQAWNILQSADPSSREYATAYSIVSQPKTQLVQTENGMMPVEVPPQLPAWLKAPGTAGGPASAASAPAPGAQPGAATGTAIPGTKKPATEAQVRNQQLYTVIKPEVAIVEKNFGALSDLADQAGGAIPLASNYLTSPEYQRATNSLKTIVASYLYSVSGATANPGEVQNQIDILTPKVGESKVSIADKLARIRNMVEAVKGATGNAASPVASSQSAPSPGSVQDGYRFKGGDPADKNNWESAQ